MKLLARLRAVVTRRRVDDDLDEELADYLARAVERRKAAGLPPEEATRLARAEIGSAAAIKDRVHDVSRAAALMTTWQDIRYGVRLMNRSRGFTLVAALVLSLGIGTTTALFSIINALLFTPLTVPKPDELVSVYTLFPDGRFGSVLKHEFEAFVESGAQLAYFTSRSFGGTAIAVDDDVQRATGEYIEGGYFSVLQVGTAVGRPLGPLDAQPGAEPAIVISYDYWQSRFLGEPVLGRQVRLLTGSTPTTATIVGVAAKGFRGLSDPWSSTQYWIARPLPLSNVFPICRLKPGVTEAHFRAFIETVTIALQERARENRPQRRWAGVTIEQLRFAVFQTADVRVPLDPNATLVPPGLLMALIVVVTLILAIATANVGGLMLARGVTRSPEIAVRRALGAGGSRVSRQLLTEGVLLAGAGGVIGVGVAFGLLAVFRATVPPAYALDTSIDWRVLLFAVAVCVMAGVFVAMGPAVQSLRANVVDALGGGPASTKQTRTRLRYWVVVPQVALSLVLLVIASVHLRVLARFEQASLGYEPDGRIAFTTVLVPPVPASRAMQMPAEERRQLTELAVIRARRLATEVHSRLATIPGVGSVGIAERMPFQPYFELGQRRLMGTSSDVRVHASQTTVSGGYFETMRIRLLTGRNFTDDDVIRATPPVVISRSLAEKLWPAAEPVGKVISFEPDPRFRSTSDLERLEVVGVVDDVFPVLGTLADRALMYRFALIPVCAEHLLSTVIPAWLS